MNGKCFAVVLCLTMFSGSCRPGERHSDEGDSEPSLVTSHSDDGAPMWVGTIEKRHLQQAPFNAWFDSGYTSYAPRSEAMTALATSLDSVEIEVYLGTWCSDSTRDVPRLHRVLDDAAFPTDRLEMVALSDRPGEFKHSPAGKERERLVHRTPTIVISREGRELGRIVQNSRNRIEEDIVAILNDEPYQARFGAEARLHEIASTRGIEAFEGRSSELAQELGQLGESDSLWHYAQYDLLVNDKPREAAIVLDVFVTLYPESARGYFLLARAHRALQELDEALAAVRHSLSLGPGNDEARLLEEELVRATSP